MEHAYLYVDNGDTYINGESKLAVSLEQIHLAPSGLPTIFLTCWLSMEPGRERDAAFRQTLS